MKSLILAALAAICVAQPAFAQPPYDNRGDWRDQYRDNDRGDWDRGVDWHERWRWRCQRDSYWCRRMCWRDQYGFLQCSRDEDDRFDWRRYDWWRQRYGR